MTQNMVQPVYDYPRRYTAKQLKTIYYSLIDVMGYEGRKCIQLLMKWSSILNLIVLYQ